MWDNDLFLFLNFDGGAAMDSLMSVISGKVTWLPLYMLLLWGIYRKGGWRNVALFALCVIAAVGLSDIVAGIFKHSGPLKNLWESFPVRLRPMHSPELEGLIHKIGGGGKYGTISAHAATTTAIAYAAGREFRSTLVRAGLVIWVAAVCYSRIYLAYHFPQDILLGIATGVICAAGPYALYSRVAKK